MVPDLREDAGDGRDAGSPGQVGLPRWEHFHHGADIGVRGIASTEGGAFEQTATALTAVLTEPAGVRAAQAVEIHCDAPDHELLLVDWLNALVYEMATRHMVFGRFTVDLRDGALRGTAWGEPLDVARHQPAVEVKGATYTALEVGRRKDGLWQAQCVVDV